MQTLGDKMRVKCVDESGVDLTFGEWYIVLKETKKKLKIKNDRGKKKKYYKERFITREQEIVSNLFQEYMRTPSVYA